MVTLPPVSVYTLKDSNLDSAGPQRRTNLAALSTLAARDGAVRGSSLQ
jgi:hypothetical protein